MCDDLPDFIEPALLDAIADQMGERRLFVPNQNLGFNEKLLVTHASAIARALEERGVEFTALGGFWSNTVGSYVLCDTTVWTKDAIEEALGG